MGAVADMANRLPIQPFEQSRELCGRQFDRPIRWTGPLELPALKVLVNQYQTGLIPN